MAIDVELLAPGRAMVFRSPSLLARILLGRRASARGARQVLVVTGGYRWVYDDTTTRVDPCEPEVVAALDSAARTARSMRQVLEPPL